MHAVGEFHAQLGRGDLPLFMLSCDSSSPHRCGSKFADQSVDFEKRCEAFRLKRGQMSLNTC